MVSLVRFSFWPAHHPRGMKAISPGSRSASGVGRPRPVSDPEGVAAQCAANPPGSVCRTTFRHRWWRCAYHRLIAANPPGLSHGTKTAPVNQIVLPLVLAAHTACAAYFPAPVYLVSVAEGPCRVGQAERSPTNLGKNVGGTALRLSHPTFRNRN